MSSPDEPAEREPLILRMVDVACPRCGLGVTVQFFDNGTSRVLVDWPEFKERCEIELEPSPYRRCEALEGAIDAAANVH